MNRKKKLTLEIYRDLLLIQFSDYPKGYILLGETIEIHLLTKILQL